MANYNTGVQRPKKVRSRITNNPYALIGVNMRSARGRRYRDIVDALIGTFGDSDPVGLRELAGLKFTLECLQSDLVTGDRPNVAEDLVRVSNLIARREKSMRTAKPAAPAPILLHEYLRTRQAESAATDE